MNPPSPSDAESEKEVLASDSLNSDGHAEAGFVFLKRHAILIALVVWVFGCNVIWVVLDEVPPAYDYARHLYITFLYWQAFDWSSQSLWFDLLSVEPFYPPLYHLLLLPFALAFGFSAYSAVLANSIYLGIIILSTYGVGSLIYGRRAGLMAAFLVACFPFLSYSSRTPMIDTLLVAAVTLSYYLFLKSKNFECRRYSLMFSIVFAGGMMVKWTLLIYILPAVVLGLVGDRPLELKRTLIQSIYFIGMILALLVVPLSILVLGELKWIALLVEVCLIGVLVRAMPLSRISLTKILNLITLTVISLIICFPWYSHTLLNLIQGGMKSNLSGIREGDPTTGIERWTHYMHFIQMSVGGILFLLFLAGATFCLVRRKHFKPLLFGWIVFSYFMFSLITNHDLRYIMPILPSIAVISSFWIFQVQRNLVRRTLVALTLVIGLYTYLQPFVKLQAKTNPGAELEVLGTSLFGEWSAPSAGMHWPLDHVLNDIIDEAALEEGETVTVRTLTNHRFFQRGGFRNMVAFNDLPIVVKSVKRNVGELTDFFITKEDPSTAGTFWQRDIKPKKVKLLEDPALRRTFPLFKKYLLPDGTHGLVFKRDVSPATDIEGVEDLNDLGERFLRALAEYPIYGIKDGVNMTISIEPTENPEDLYLGIYKSIQIKADSAVSNGIQFHDFGLTFEGIQINLYDLFYNGKLILFKLDQISPRGTILFEDLEKLAAKSMKNRGRAWLEGRKDRLILKANYSLQQGRNLTSEAIIRIDFEPNQSIRPVLESFNIGPLSIPKAFYRRKSNIVVNLKPTLGWPLNTDIRSFKIFPRRLEINQYKD